MKVAFDIHIDAPPASIGSENLLQRGTKRPLLTLYFAPSYSTQKFCIARLFNSIPSLCHDHGRLGMAIYEQINDDELLQKKEDFLVADMRD